MESEVKYGDKSQNHDKFHIPWKTER